MVSSHLITAVYTRRKLLTLFIFLLWIFTTSIHLWYLHSLLKTMQKSTAKPLFDVSSTLCTFGVIADIQYADIPDGSNYAKTRERYYRNSLNQLKVAVEEWNKVGAKFVLDMGDVIDGFSRRVNHSITDLQSVLNVYEDFKGPTFFQWGNHDFYNFKREELIKMKTFNSSLYEFVQTTNCSDEVYYQFKACDGFSIISLDMYEISMLGWNRKSEAYKEAEKILFSKNNNSELNSSRGLKGKDVRFVKYNGAVSQKQLDWLDETLNVCDQTKERVLVFGHIPVFEAASDVHCVSWNSDEILSVFHKHPSVAAYFAGHNHDGGYAVDVKGIHHMTFQGVIETKPGENTFAIISVTQEGLIVKGFGKIPSMTLNFNRKFDQL